MNQRWRLVALWLLPIGVVLLIGWQVISNGGLNSQNAGGTTVAPRNAAVARMSYGGARQANKTGGMQMARQSDVTDRHAQGYLPSAETRILGL